MKYQVVVEIEEPDLLVFSVDLPPSDERMRVKVPAEFIAAGIAAAIDEGEAVEFKFEILVREASGNQTAVESCFGVD